MPTLEKVDFNPFERSAGSGGQVALEPVDFDPFATDPAVPDSAREAFASSVSPEQPGVVARTIGAVVGNVVGLGDVMPRLPLHEDRRDDGTIRFGMQPVGPRRYGLRNDGTVKGPGFLGELRMQDGSGDVATELSIGVDFDGRETEIPLLVPTLGDEEVQSLLRGEPPTDDIIQKAVAHARSRLSVGKSPFFDDNVPESRGEVWERQASEISSMMGRGVVDTARKVWDGDADIQTQDDLNQAFLQARQSAENSRKFMEDRKDWPEGLPEGLMSVPYSAVTLGASLAGQVVGARVGGNVGAMAGGMAASGTSAYRAAKREFKNQLLLQAASELGRVPTIDEWKDLETRFETQAVKSGLYEAGPEAVGSLLFLKILGPWSKAITEKIGSKLGAGLAGKVASSPVGRGVVAFGGTQAEEQLTEGITSWGQGGAEAEAGLRDKAPTLGEAFSESIKPTFYTTALTGGLGSVAQHLGEKWDASRPIDLTRDMEARTTENKAILDKGGEVDLLDAVQPEGAGLVADLAAAVGDLAGEAAAPRALEPWGMSLTKARTKAVELGLDPTGMERPQIIEMVRSRLAAPDHIVGANKMIEAKPVPLDPVQAIDQSAHEAATSPVNDLPEPTPAQKEAGNYRKGHVRAQGFDIAVENPQGSERGGVDEGGQPWSVTMQNHYGYIKGTVGADKDHLDVFLGPDPTTGDIFIVDQVDPKTGEFDEHKIMMGFQDAQAARDAYLSNYSDGWQGLGAVTRMPLGTFRKWARSSKTKRPVGVLAPRQEQAMEGAAPQPEQGAVPGEFTPEELAGMMPEQAVPTVTPGLEQATNKDSLAVQAEGHGVVLEPVDFDPFAGDVAQGKENAATFPSQDVKENVTVDGVGSKKTRAEIRAGVLAEMDEAENARFEDMVKDAARWRGAARNLSREIGSETKEQVRASVRLSKITTKGDLDAYLMRKYGISDVEAREVSNSLTARNVPDDMSATVEDFKDEPWVQEFLAKGVKEPWQMTRDEALEQEVASWARALQEALGRGRQVTARTNLRQTVLTRPDDVRASGTSIQIPGGNKNGQRQWVAVTGETLYDMMRQVGVPAKWDQTADMVHDDVVGQAIADGRPVPENVLAEYEARQKRWADEEEDAPQDVGAVKSLGGWPVLQGVVREQFFDNWWSDEAKVRAAMNSIYRAGLASESLQREYASGLTTEEKAEAITSFLSQRGIDRLGNAVNEVSPAEERSTREVRGSERWRADGERLGMFMAQQVRDGAESLEKALEILNNNIASAEHGMRVLASSGNKDSGAYNNYEKSLTISTVARDLVRKSDSQEGESGKRGAEPGGLGQSESGDVRPDAGGRGRESDGRGEGGAASGRLKIPGATEHFTYKVVEARDVRPSHDPLNDFDKRVDYPFENERAYHKSGPERDKVIENALNLDPDLLLESPTAEHGAPVTDGDLNVLGGNSRAMSLQYAYQRNPKNAARYRAALEDAADKLGLDAGVIREMERPVLVRVLDQAVDAERAKKLIPAFNEGFTQAVDPDALGVSRGLKISAETVDILGAGLEENDTLRDYLSSRAAKDFVDALIQDGALDRTRLTAVMRNGELTKEGKAEIERMVRGVIVQDYALLESLPQSLLNALDKSLPSLIRLRFRGEGWDINAAMVLALRHVARFRNGNEKHLDLYFRTKEMFGEIEGKRNRTVQILAYALDNMGHDQFGKAASAYTKLAFAGQKKVGMLPGMGQVLPTKQEALEKFRTDKAPKDLFGERVAEPVGADAEFSALFDEELAAAQGAASAPKALRERGRERRTKAVGDGFPSREQDEERILLMHDLADLKRRPVPATADARRARDAEIKAVERRLKKLPAGTLTEDGVALFGPVIRRGESVYGSELFKTWITEGVDRLIAEDHTLEYDHYAAEGWDGGNRPIVTREYFNKKWLEYHGDKASKKIKPSELTDKVVRAQARTQRKPGQTMKDARAQARAGADKMADGLRGAMDVFSKFGGLSVRIVEDGQKIDETLYGELKPHLLKVAEGAREMGLAGKDMAREVVRFLIQGFGDKAAQAKPYFMRFVREEIIGGGDVDQQRGGADLERDSGRGEAGDGLGPDGVDHGRGGTGPTGRSGVQGSARSRGGARRGGGVSGREAVSSGAQGDRPVRAPQSPAPGGPAGSELSERGHTPGDGGPVSDTASDGAVARAAAGGASLADRVALQKKAESVPVKASDLENIQATLPVLFEGQHRDVQFAESRFAVGSGVMFTNGTGTGKTGSGLGIIKRLVKAGKSNILIAVPAEKIGSDWIKFGVHLGLNITALKDTKDAGRGVVVTTHANLGLNNALSSRTWDLIVIDEAHKLMSSADAANTDALRALRAISLHPDGVGKLLDMRHPDKAERMRMLGRAKDKSWVEANELDQLHAWHREALKELQAEVAAAQGRTRAQLDTADGRAGVVFLSATPFAYVPNVEYAEGYLFDFSDRKADGYNSGNGRQHFFMQHFGYRMRYNKLTRPDANVDVSLMERQFNSWLKREKVLSTRTLQVEFDYDRRFVLVDSAIGRKIDEGLDLLRSKRFRELGDKIGKVFDHLARRYLLEAIKAKEVIPVIREHLALGRKVVVFHDYKLGGTQMNPFDVGGFTLDDDDDVRRQAVMFRDERPDLVNLPIAGLQSPINALQSAFPDILLFNGSVPAKERSRAVEQFQDDNSGKNLILVQSAAGEAGISLHDTTGKHQRVLINLGLPTRPVTATQQEGRIYRVGQASDALFRYLNTGTSWERWAFASTIAERASTAENLAMGEEARALKDAFVQAFEDSDAWAPGHENEGRGGKERDAAAISVLSDWDRAKTYYFGQQKKTSRTKAAEGADYFATPEPLGLKMVEWAGIEPGMDALEPSAGHGAIVRWFPDLARKVAVEPSHELASRIGLVSDAKIITSRFEDHHIVNKYDAIVMNPPFGTAGKTAMEHVAKAFAHLREGGRLVALIPEGPSMGKRFDAWYESEEARHAHLRMSVSLPAVAFERAGTSVRARVVVLDKAERPVGHVDQRSPSEVAGGTIKEFFDNLEHRTAPERVQTEAQREKQQVEMQEASRGVFFEAAQTKHTKTGADLYVAKKAGLVSKDDYKKLASMAEGHDGWWSSFKGGNAIPGFQFKEKAQRDAFLQEANAALQGGAPDVHLSRRKAGEVAGKGLTLRDVQGIVRTVVRDWKAAPPVEVVADVADLPAQLLDHVRKQGAEGDVQAVYSGGTIYLVASRMTSARHVHRTMLHEATLHHGLSVIMSASDRRRALDAAMRNKAVRSAMDEIASVYGLDLQDQEQAREAAEEVLAHWAENGAPTDGQTAMQRFVNAIRRALRRIFTGMAMTDAEIMELMANARRAVVEGEGAKKGDGLRMQRAFHGTPVRDIEKNGGFQLAYRGTGEGRKSFDSNRSDFKDLIAWGHYVAGDKAVAENYRKRLSNPTGDNWTNPMGYDPRAGDDKGQLYEVEIPENHELLDWDKPLSAQPEQVRAGVESLRTSLAEDWLEDALDYMNADFNELTGKEFYRLLERAVRDDAIPLNAGEPAERAVEQGNLQRAAAELLLTEDIKGVRYLDGFSRKKGEGTHNYVVFSDPDVEIVATHYKRAGANLANLPAPAPATTSATLRRQIDYLRMKFQDKFLPLKRVQEMLQGQGWKMTNEADAYRAEELFHGRAGHRLEKFQEDVIGPLTEKIGKSGLSVAELEDYLYARYAPQRNAHIASINPAMPDGGSGRTNQWAADTLARFDSEGKTAKLAALAREVRRVTQMQRDIIRKEGLESEEIVDAWELDNPDYVPLKGGPHETGRTIGTGFNIKRSGTRRAMGRASVATDILANLFAQVGDTIIRAEKTRVGRAFLKMAEQNPNAEVWKVHSRLPMKRAMVNGEVGKVVDFAFPQKDNVLTVTLDDGSVRYVELFDDDLARVMKNLTPGQHGRVTQALAAFTRFLSIVNTSLNPEFVVTNFERDLMTASVHLAGEQGKGLVKKVVKGIPSAMRGIGNYLRGDRKHEWAEWFELFRASGAQVSFMDLRGVDQIKRDIAAAVAEKAGGLASSRRAARSVLDFIGDMNNAVENAVRLSAFRHAVEAGMPIYDAASMAKNLTVNFNRKGELGPAMNALYMFFNAGVQGSARILGALKNRKVQAMMAATVLLAWGLAELNRFIGGDDDDDENKWDKHVNDWSKQTNLILMLPDGDSLKIKLPYGYNFFVATGYALSDVFHWSKGDGGKNPADAATFLFKAAMNAFNPMGDDSLLQMLSPTVLDPFVQIATNENFMGNKIMPEQDPYGPPRPESQLYFRSASKASRVVAEQINALTGGNTWESGAVDVSPEVIDHLVGFLSGGLGRTARDAAGLPWALTDSELVARQVPFLRQVYQQRDDRADLDRFYQHAEKVEIAMKQAEELPRVDVAEFARQHPELDLHRYVSRTRRAMGVLRKQMYAAMDAGDAKMAEQKKREMSRLATLFNRKYNRAIARQKK